MLSCWQTEYSQYLFQGPATVTLTTTLPLKFAAAHPVGALSVTKGFRGNLRHGLKVNTVFVILQPHVVVPQTCHTS